MLPLLHVLYLFLLLLRRCSSSNRSSTRVSHATVFPSSILIDSLIHALIHALIHSYTQNAISLFLFLLLFLTRSFVTLSRPRGNACNPGRGYLDTLLLPPPITRSDATSIASYYKYKLKSTSPQAATARHAIKITDKQETHHSQGVWWGEGGRGVWCEAWWGETS